MVVTCHVCGMVAHFLIYKYDINFSIEVVLTCYGNLLISDLKVNSVWQGSYVMHMSARVTFVTSF